MSPEYQTSNERKILHRAWWKEAIIYQIYPASFHDSNGDGIGDLNGIHSKLDYLKDLGVDVVWLSPIYRSPQRDMGYDIADYRDVDPRYGTLADWNSLVEGLHSRNMKIMMDLVVNHTSVEHAWFKESRSSKTNPKRDWYFWRPPRYGDEGVRMPPNNWQSLFKGSAWDWDETTQEYYLHIYDRGQPDLNWENPAVREVIWDMMRLWFDRGTDGFRMDVINLISKVPGLPDAPIANPNEKFQPASMYFANGPCVHDYLKEMHEQVLSKYNNITVGETPFADMHELAKYVLPALKELNMAFLFELMDLDADGKTRLNALRPRKWSLPEFKEIINRWQTFMREEGFWNSVYLENHDQPRSVSRFGSDAPRWRAVSAKMLAILQIAQSGTLYVYQGEEIGMANAPRSWGIEEYKDVKTESWHTYTLHLRKRKGNGEDVDMSDVMDGVQKKARDHGRLPVQWDASHHAGFTAGTPWMRVNDDYKEWNVANQMKDEGSVLNFWRKALELRKKNHVLIYGDFQPLVLSKPEDEEKIYAFVRRLDGDEALVVLNFTPEDVEWNLDGFFPLGSRLLLSNYPDVSSTLSDGVLLLRGYEGRIYQK